MKANKFNLVPQKAYDGMLRDNTQKQINALVMFAYDKCFDTNQITWLICSITISHKA